MITYFKKRTVESVLAALIFLVLIAVTPVWLQWWRIGTDPGLFLEVRQVYVNDAPYSKDHRSL